MKKLLILLITVISVLTLKAQDSPLSILPDSSKLTLTKVYNDTKAGITGLAAALKTPAVHVYKVLIRQQIVNSVIYLILLLISILLLKSIPKAVRNKEEDWTDGDDPTPIFFMRLTQIIFGLILFAIGIINLSNIITGFINPEYGAIKDIISFIK